MPERNYALDAPDEGRWIDPPAVAYRPKMPTGKVPAIGLVGCGGIAATHLQAYRDVGWPVTVLCHRTIAKAEKLRDEYFPQANVVADAAEVFADPNVAVVDLTPHPEDRAPLIEAALRAGKHVLSQKPFVVDLEVGRRLCDLADERGLVLAVNQNGRWAPHLAYLRETVRAGLIGLPTAVRVGIQWDHNWIAGTPFDEVRHILLYDFAIHWLDFVVSVFASQRSERVFASIQRSSTQTAKPALLAQIAVEFPAGQASLSFDADCRLDPEDRTVVVGSTGVARGFGPSLSDQQVVVATSAGRFRPTLEGSWFPGGFAGAMGELLHAIETGTVPQHHARGNLDALELCFAAVASAERGTAVEVGTIRSLAEAMAA